MINISQPRIGEEEIRLVTDAVSSGWVSSQGKYIQEFEQLFAEYCGSKYCVLTANGTVSLHLAMAALRIGPGDEVIIPDLTFVATANTVMMAGATPILADVNMDDWCLDAADVERKITSRTKAIIPVHLYGHPANMTALQEIADRHQIHLIEDAAEAHGAEHGGKKVGSLGTFGSFSFFGNKIITTGEGGALTTDSQELAERAKFLRDHGMSKEKRYFYTEIGYNYRMTNLQAALGVAQLKKIDSLLASRREILETYKHYLGDKGFTLNPHLTNNNPVNWMTCVVIDDFDKLKREHLQKQLLNKGIDSRPFFYTVSELPMYQRTQCEVSARLSNTGLNLPTFPGLSESEIKYISEEFAIAVENCANIAV